VSNLIIFRSSAVWAVSFPVECQLVECTFTIPFVSSSNRDDHKT
jgi:hypothetical protein